MSRDAIRSACSTAPGCLNCSHGTPLLRSICQRCALRRIILKKEMSLIRRFYRDLLSNADCVILEGTRIFSLFLVFRLEIMVQSHATVINTGL